MNEALPTLYIFGAGGFGREVLDLARLVNADTPRWSISLLLLILQNHLSNAEFQSSALSRQSSQRETLSL